MEVWLISQTMNGDVRRGCCHRLYKVKFYMLLIARSPRACRIELGDLRIGGGAYAAVHLDLFRAQVDVLESDFASILA
jgi:hypothetical protein